MKNIWLSAGLFVPGVLRTACMGAFLSGRGVAPCMKPVDEEADRGRGYPPTNSDNIKSLGLADREMPWQRQQNAAQVPSRKSNGWSLCIQFEFHRRQPCCFWVRLRSWCCSGSGRRGRFAQLTGGSLVSLEPLPASVLIAACSVTGFVLTD